MRSQNRSYSRCEAAYFMLLVTLLEGAHRWPCRLWGELHDVVLKWSWMKKWWDVSDLQPRPLPSLYPGRSLPGKMSGQYLFLRTALVKMRAQRSRMEQCCAIWPRSHSSCLEMTFHLSLWMNGRREAESRSFFKLRYFQYGWQKLLGRTCWALGRSFGSVTMKQPGLLWCAHTLLCLTVCSWLETAPTKMWKHKPWTGTLEFLQSLTCQMLHHVWISGATSQWASQRWNRCTPTSHFEWGGRRGTDLCRIESDHIPRLKKRMADWESEWIQFCFERQLTFFWHVWCSCLSETFALFVFLF